MISEPVPTADGSFTLRHPLLGETYHARDGARTEALYKFIHPSGLAERLRSRPLRLLDIGFGLGINCRAALEAAEAAPHPLEVDSLEREPEALDRALSLAPSDPLLLDLARDRAHCRGPHRVTLHLGDARQRIQQLPGPWDLIFHDPFSPLRNTECWTADFFALLRARSTPESVLLSYSQSLIVRAGLNAAGWRVTHTPAHPPHRGGILAVPDASAPPPETLPWRDPCLNLDSRSIRAHRESLLRAQRTPGASRP